MLVQQPSIEEVKFDTDEKVREVLQTSSEINIETIHQIEHIINGNEEQISHATLY
jgi:hypothetical protein